MRRAGAATARCGFDVVVHHVLPDREAAVDLARSLRGVPTALVGVRCEERSGPALTAVQRLLV